MDGNFRVRAKGALIVLVCLLAMPATAAASIQFYTNQGAFSSAVNAAGISTENILFNQPGAVLGPANTVTGVGNTSGLLLDISDNDPLGELQATAMGAADVQPTDGSLMSGMFSPKDFDFLVALAFAVQFNDAVSTDTVTITVQEDDDTFTSSDPFLLGQGQGQRFYGVIAVDDQRIANVSFTTTSVGGVSSIRQIEMAAAEPGEPPPPPPNGVIPEPTSVAAWGLLMAAGLVVAGGRRHFVRSRSQSTAQPDAK